MKPENHVTDQLAAYALSLLDATEAAQVEAHLATCASCQQELYAYREVTGLLALAAPTVTPPPALKQQLLQEIEDDLETAASTRPTPSSTEPQTSWWETLRNWFQKRPLWQPALVLVLLVLVISNFQLRQRLEDANRPANFGTVTLTATEEGASASGVLIISADGEHGTLVVQELPQLPETEGYQLWLVKDGQRISGPVFNVAEDGYRAVWVQSPDPLGSYETFGITIEPAEGSPGPTGEKVLGN